ncbi:MAG: universal stress protein, partial [Nitrospirae bacterium]|nr:universal stress protein [Nitrospirota bacterium]
MGKYRKILVAVDGSLPSMHALRQSFALAVNEKCWMTAVSVIPPYLGDLETTGVGNVMASLRKPCEDALTEAARLAAETRIMMRTVCEEGEAHERIVDLSDSENFDLIVTGRRGHGSLERALVGSVAARVIGYAHKDVLVVPMNAEVGWDKILLATDGSKFSETAAEKAIDFARSYGGELLITSVVDVPAEFYGDAPDVWDKLVDKAKTFVAAAKEKAESAGVRARTFVKEGETWRMIIDLAAEQKVRTIVLGAHGKTGLKRLLMGSVTEKVIG